MLLESQTELLWFGFGAIEELKKQLVSWCCHFSVIVSIQFTQFCIGVPNDLHHSPEVRVFLVSAQQFQVPIAGYQQHGRSVVSHVIERCHFINDWLFVINASLFANCEMSNCVAAEGDESGDLICIELVDVQPPLIEADHAGEISTGRMATNEDALR